MINTLAAKLFIFRRQQVTVALRRDCTAIDCVLADDWDSWSECSVRCGTGIKKRVRRVLQAPLNGGRPCPGNTVEKAVCEGTSCKVVRASNGMDELRGQSLSTFTSEIH